MQILNPTDFFSLNVFRCLLIIYGCGLLVCGFLVALTRCSTAAHTIHTVQRTRLLR